MEATVTSRSRGAGREIESERARACLAEGRHGEALEALRRAGRGRSREDGPLLALQEAEALCGLLRYREALAVVTRALRRCPSDPDLVARLRLARGHALWTTGRVGPGKAEVRKAAESACAPLTRARAEETLGLFAWKEQAPAAAREHLAAALALYEDAGSLVGCTRVLEKEGGLLRGERRMEEALRVLDRRLETAARTARVDALAAARNDRGDLLANQGRWGEAREELDRAAALYREAADPRELTLAGVNRAALDLAVGDLAGARAALERAREVLGPECGDPRSVAEVFLLVADLHVAVGEPGPAERAAVEALAAFALVKDREGECRSRVRRTHALLGLGRVEEALREARRALRAAVRPDLEALAGLALGRALLRKRSAEALLAFDRVLALCDGRTGLTLAARLGRALARGAGREDEEVRLSLAGLEMWGDRRLLALCLADLREIVGMRPSVPLPPVPSAEAGGAPPDARSWIDAALALAGDGEWNARWAVALRALRPILPWCRAALVERAGWELRDGLDGPAPLAGTDLARELAAAARGPRVVDLLREPAWRGHPVRVLHQLGAALVVPVSNALVLYLDRREGEPMPDERELALAVEAGRLLAAHAPAGLPEEGQTPRFPEIVGRCAAMEALFSDMGRVAASSLSVHIFGETGTGKEKVAEALHRRSSRRGAFVAVNASSLPDELFEAEMFGHTRGAFTGAVAAREGHVAAAEGGTLFIDEVADLTLRGQAKLLRFLEDGEFRRLGESVTRRADVRVLTAANVALRERVASGRFREDLVYRLAPVTLSLPPLRERGDDLLLLARHFLREAAAREGLPSPALPQEVARALVAHSWPGNVRELQNEMKRLVVLAGTGSLRREQLSPHVLGARPASLSSLREAQAGFERDYLRRSLGHNGGNRARTAHVLGVTRQALVAKIRRLGL